MTQLAALAETSAKIFLLSDEDVRRAADEVASIEALDSESHDLLPLDAFVRLTERSRAA